MRYHAVFCGAMLALLVSPCADAAKLGDSAAPLAVKEWVKGNPVDVKDGNHIYVVEFWATWCVPCKISIPHMTELQKSYKDKGVIFVGISDETAEKVKPFVKQMGTNMDYTVAIDTEDAKSHSGYTEAYGLETIPACFVVGKDAKVLWFGNPLLGLDPVLEEIVSGKYDLAGAIKRDETRTLAMEYYQLASARDPKARDAGRKFIAHAGTNAQDLCDFAFSVVNDWANTNRDFSLAREALDKAEQVVTATNHWLLGVRAVMQFESGKKDEGIALARQALSFAPTSKDRTNYQNFLTVMLAEVQKKEPQPPATSLQGAAPK